MAVEFRVSIEFLLHY